MYNIIHYLLVLIHAYPVKISIVLILKYYSYDITHKSKITYLITTYMYYVESISICNGIIGADAIGLRVLFTVCVKVIGPGRVSSYLGGD